MATIKSVVLNFHIFLLAIILTIVPYAGIEAPVINNAEDNCQLTVELISDIHIEKYNPYGQLFLTRGLKNLKKAKIDIDALLVCGDITNYVDEAALIKYYDIIKKHSPVPVITLSGNHDLRHNQRSKIPPEEALEYFLKHANNYYGTDYKVPYYSKNVNGYKFIILSDEVLSDEVLSDGTDTEVRLSKEQLDFLDSELAAATADGSPAFVCCHWPVDGTNGQELIFPEGAGAINIAVNDVKSIMEKYKNVFYISGHIHGGIKSTSAAKVSGISNVEQKNGVTYISLPTYGSLNFFGYTASGTGMQLEVYENKVIIRPRNFITNSWFTNAVYTIDLV